MYPSTAIAVLPVIHEPDPADSSTSWPIASSCNESTSTCRCSSIWRGNRPSARPSRESSGATRRR
jgi:hypothetical protein